MIEEMDNTCAFCGNPVTNSGETVMVTSAYKVTFDGTDKGQMKLIDNTSQISHQDCWEGRNNFAPARQRVLHFGGSDSV